jgi:hypothetical protein
MPHTASTFAQFEIKALDKRKIRQYRHKEFGIGFFCLDFPYRVSGRIEARPVPGKTFPQKGGYRSGRLNR